MWFMWSLFEGASMSGENLVGFYKVREYYTHNLGNISNF